MKTIVMGLDKIKKTPCGFCFVEYHGRDDAERRSSTSTAPSSTIATFIDFDWGFRRRRRPRQIRRPGSRRVSHHVRRGTRRLRNAPQDGTRRVAGGGEAGGGGEGRATERSGRGERARGAGDAVNDPPCRRRRWALSAGGRFENEGTRRSEVPREDNESDEDDITPGYRALGGISPKNAEATTRGKTETYRKAHGAPLDRPNLCDSRYITVCSYNRTLAPTTRTPPAAVAARVLGVVRRDGNFSHEGWRRRYARGARDAPPRISRVWAAPGSQSRRAVIRARPRAETSARTSPGVASPFASAAAVARR